MNVLLVDPLPPTVIEGMRGAVPSPHRLDAVTDASEDDLARRAADAHVFVVVHRRIDARVLALAPHLSFVQRFGVGYDNIDLDAARAAGVAVSYTPGANADSVAEHALMLMLVVLKRLPFAAHRTRSGEWPAGEFLSQAVPDLAGATVGLVGMGATGSAVASRLRPFGCRIVYFARHRLAGEREDVLSVSYLDFHDLIAGADILSLHVPLTPESRGMFGRDAFARMRQGAVFINTARGELVDEAALHDAVASGRLAGAGLDVLDREESGGNPFSDLPQVVVTPHYAGATRGAQRAILRLGLANVLRVLAGEPPEHLLVDGRPA